MRDRKEKWSKIHGKVVEKLKNWLFWCFVGHSSESFRLSSVKLGIYKIRVGSKKMWSKICGWSNEKWSKTVENGRKIAVFRAAASLSGSHSAAFLPGALKLYTSILDTCLIEFRTLLDAWSKGKMVKNTWKSGRKAQNLPFLRLRWATVRKVLYLGPWNPGYIKFGWRTRKFSQKFVLIE